MLNLRDDTGVWARNIFCPKVDRMGTARTVPAFVSQKRQKPAKRPSPSWGGCAYGQAWRGQSVHAGAPPPMQSARARARNGKQNAPRTSRCSTRARVVRFASRFSRARADVPSMSWAPRPRQPPESVIFDGFPEPYFSPEYDHFCIFLGQQKNRGEVVIAWTVLWT